MFISILGERVEGQTFTCEEADAILREVKQELKAEARRDVKEYVYLMARGRRDEAKALLEKYGEGKHVALYSTAGLDPRQHLKHLKDETTKYRREQAEGQGELDALLSDAGHKHLDALFHEFVEREKGWIDRNLTLVMIAVGGVLHPCRGRGRERRPGLGWCPPVLVAPDP